MHTSKGKHRRTEAVSETEGSGATQRGKKFRGRVVARVDHADINLNTIYRIAKSVSDQLDQNGHRLRDDDEEE